jgi:hypothetical protein
MSWGVASSIAALAVVLVGMAVFYAGFLAIFGAVAAVATLASAGSRTTRSRKLGQ